MENREIKELKTFDEIITNFNGIEKITEEDAIKYIKKHKLNITKNDSIFATFALLIIVLLMIFNIIKLSTGIVLSFVSLIFFIEGIKSNKKYKSLQNKTAYVAEVNIYDKRRIMGPGSIDDITIDDDSYYVKVWDMKDSCINKRIKLSSSLSQLYYHPENYKIKVIIFKINNKKDYLLDILADKIN